MLPIDGSRLTLDQLVAVARHRVEVHLEPRARREMLRSYAWVQQAVEGTSPVYGVNTGYGSLARVRIPREKLNELSRNLVRSHAAGVADNEPHEPAEEGGCSAQRRVAGGVAAVRARAHSRARAAWDSSAAPLQGWPRHGGVQGGRDEWHGGRRADQGAE